MWPALGKWLMACGEPLRSLASPAARASRSFGAVANLARSAQGWWHAEPLRAYLTSSSSDGSTGESSSSCSGSFGCSRTPPSSVLRSTAGSACAIEHNTYGARKGAGLTWTYAHANSTLSPTAQLLRCTAGTPPRIHSSAASYFLKEGELGDSHDKAMEELNKVLVQPISHSRDYNGQLSPHLVRLHGQLFVEPEKVLTSTIRALLVLKHVLRDDGHVYVVGSHPLLRPLMHEAARCCLNPNVWFYSEKWVPGMLTNYRSHRRLFKPSHQPNRRLLMQKGVRMSNVHCPQPRPQDKPLPRLSWEDKWALLARSELPGYRDLLRVLLEMEDAAQTFPAPGMLHGRARQLRLMLVLDSTTNRIAIQEAAQRNIMTMALVNHNCNLSSITYPIFARDYHPAYVHFFLDWMMKITNSRGNHITGSGDL